MGILKFWKPIWLAFALTTTAIASYLSGADLFVTGVSLLGVSFVVAVNYHHRMANLLGAGLYAALGWMAWDAGVVGNALVNGLILFPMSLMAFWLWWGKNTKISQPSARQMGEILLATTTLTGLVYIGLEHIGSNHSVFDAMTTVIPIIATLALMAQSSSCWPLFTIYNTLSVILWGQMAVDDPLLWSIVYMKGVFFVNGLLGWYNWRKIKS